MDLEFVDESPSGDDVPEQLPAGGQRTSRWLPAIAVLVLAAIAAAVVIQRSGHDTPTPRAQASAPATASYVPPFPNNADPTRPVTLDTTMFSIYAVARDSVPAHDVIRGGSSTGSCKTVRIGTVPQKSIAASLIRALGSFKAIDSARIIDQDAGLCSVQVRASNGNGVIAVLVVTAPDRESASHGRDATRSGDGKISGDYVEYSVFRSGDGWGVTVGATGVRSKLPTATTLARISADPTLRW